MLAVKQDHFVERDLTPLKLYSMVKFRRTDRVTSLNVQIAKTLYAMRRYLSRKCPDSWKSFIRNGKMHFLG